jgi:hypothetical protein
MDRRPSLVARVCGALLIAASALVSAQLPLDVIRESGQSVTPAYEGWYRDRDGSRKLLIGYYNRNTKQVIEIPVGPENRLEPGGPDLGQPTLFQPRRGWGVFTIPVPADFGDKKITWTITANGKSESIPFGLHPNYEVEPFKDAAMGNTPPTLKFSPTGQTFQGPPVGVALTLAATMGQALPLEMWADDDGHEEPGGPSPFAAKQPRVVPSWHVHRKPVGSEVKFENARPAADLSAGGRTTTTATFSQAGEYMIRAQLNDNSGEGGGGFQCCWTNALVKVNVK